MKPLQLLLIIPFMLLLSCDKADDTIEAREIQADISQTLEEEFELPFGEVALVEPESLLIRFLDVSESRCPVTVECIWAGIVSAQLEVVYQGREMTALLTIGDAGNETFEFEGIRITLLDVLPYPEDPGAIDKEDYTIKLIVEQD